MGTSKEEQGQRLKLARTAAGYRSGPAAADAMGIKTPTYYAHENGSRRMDTPTLERYAAFYRVNLKWLVDGAGAMKGAATPTSPSGANDNRSGTSVTLDGFEFGGQTYVSIRVFDIGVSAGPGALNDDYQEPLYYDFYPLSFLQSFTRANVSNLAIVRVVGDSMVPTLHGGDVIMVDMSQTSPINHGIFVLAIGNETLVKRLQYEMSTKLVSVISDNERYKDEEMQPDDLHIIGRVVWAGGAKD